MIPVYTALAVIPGAARNSNALDEFITSLEVVSFDERAAHVYGEIRATLEKTGTPIGAMDMLIAAHAVSLGIPLVTNNTREFARITSLNLIRSDFQF